MRARLVSRLTLRAGLMVGVAFGPLLVAAGLGDPPPPIAIIVDGRTALVQAGSRLGPVVHLFGVEPADGRLFDVDGHVLQRHADPGRILVNGVVARPRTLLRDGDAITIAPGRDRVEGTRRVVTKLRGRRPGDPQFSLATAPMLRIRTVGRVSGIVAATEYRAVGPARRPPAVALTFDDGPWPGTTRRVLAILRRRHAAATFFVVGYLAERRPALVRAELHAGMAVGNHSWDHPEPFDRLPPGRIRAEMDQASVLLQRRFGVRPSLFRPPGGAWNPRMVSIADELGLRLVNWDVDPRDWVDGTSAKQIVRSVLSNVRPGSIVDLHDGGGDQRATVRALPRIIRGIRRMGLELVAIG